MKNESEEMERDKPASLEFLQTSKGAATRIRDEWKERKERALTEGLFVAAEVAQEWEIRAEVELVEINRRIRKMTKGGM